MVFRSQTFTSGGVSGMSLFLARSDHCCVSRPAAGAVLAVLAAQPSKTALFSDDGELHCDLWATDGAGERVLHVWARKNSIRQYLVTGV